LNFARHSKYTTSTIATAAGGARASATDRIAGVNQVVSPATSGVVMLATTIVSVTILQIFLFASPYVSHVAASALRRASYAPLETRPETRDSAEGMISTRTRDYIL
jgi:hypothetical protein